MQIPFDFRINRFFFYTFLQNETPSLLKLRPDRDWPKFYQNAMLDFIYGMIYELDVNRFKTHIIFKRDHKSVHKWLSNNKYFQNFLTKKFSIKNQ